MIEIFLKNTYVLWSTNKLRATNLGFAVGPPDANQITWHCCFLDWNSRATVVKAVS